MNKLRVAVVGTGHLGRAHARILSTLPGFELVAVVDALEDRCREVAAAYKARPLADARELVGHVDAVVVATPTTTHAAIAGPLLAAGMHVFVEKPLAPSTAEAEQLATAASRAGVVLQVGHVERFNPAFLAAAPVLRDVKYIDAVRASGFTFRSTDIGVVLDLMIHDIDLVLSLVRSTVIDVQALGVAVLGRHEDAANARLTFANGCVATISASRVSYAALRRFHAWTPRGFAALDFATRTATVVTASEAVLRRELAIENLTPAAQQQMRDELFATHLKRDELTVETGDQLTAELVEFGESIRTGRKPRVDGHQAAAAVAVAERILATIETHAWNGEAPGPHGPLLAPPPRIIPGPHWGAPAEVPPAQKQAG